MSNTDKIIFIILTFVIFISVSAVFYRYQVLKDYEVFLEIDEDGALINLEP